MATPDFQALPPKSEVLFVSAMDSRLTCWWCLAVFSFKSIYAFACIASYGVYTNSSIQAWSFILAFIDIITILAFITSRTVTPIPICLTDTLGSILAWVRVAVVESFTLFSHPAHITFACSINASSIHACWITNNCKVK